MFDTLVGTTDFLDVKLHDKNNSESVRCSIINSGLLMFPVESDPSSISDGTFE